LLIIISLFVIVIIMRPEWSVAVCTSSLQSFLLPISPADGHYIRSGGTNRLLVPSVRRSTVGDRAFMVAGPRVWNTLPEEITTSRTLSTFRQQLKIWLFRKSYPDIII